MILGDSGGGAPDIAILRLAAPLAYAGNTIPSAGSPIVGEVVKGYGRYRSVAGATNPTNFTVP